MAELETAQSVVPCSQAESVELLEHFDLLDDQVARQDKASPRAGLPATYRMRHDEHYIDAMLSRPGANPVRLVPVDSIAAAAPPQTVDLTPLAASIRRHGILQPLLVRGHDGGTFELIAGARRLAAARLAGLTDVPCLVYEVDEATARSMADAEHLRDDRTGSLREPIDGAMLASALAEFAERLGAVESCLDLVSTHDRPFRERVALDLVRGEARRCAWLAEALMVLGGEPLIVRAELSANALLERAMALLEPERRLGGIDVGVELMKAPPAIRGDQRLLATALAVAASAVAAIAGRAGAARIRARVQVDGSRSTAFFDLSQDQVVMPEWAVARLLDPGWHERPGGAMLGAALAGARRVAELHGGRLGATPAGRGGCAVTMVVPCG